MNKLQKYLLALFNIHEFMHIGLKGLNEYLQHISEI